MFGVTGWRLGWAIGAANLIEKLFRICICDTFGTSTLIQEAIAGMLERQRLCVSPKESYFVWVERTYAENYSKLKRAFTDANMPVVHTEGGFFMIVDCSKRKFDFQESSEYKSSDENLDKKIARGIVNEFKLALLPLSLFYTPESKDKPTFYLRACFAKSSETIDQAVEIIKTFH